MGHWSGLSEPYRLLNNPCKALFNNAKVGLRLETPEAAGALVKPVEAAGTSGQTGAHG
jgi:hypothetical protein